MKKKYLIVNILFSTTIFFFLFSPPAVISQAGPTPTGSPYPTSLNILIDLMNIFLSPGGSLQQSSFNLATPSPTLKLPSPTLYPPPLSSTIYPLSSNFVYYPQCDGSFDNLSLPNGCNLCQSGCGPATTSMILSSYIDKKFTPPVVIDLFKQKGLYAGCWGTKITDNQRVINEAGLKTTDLLFYSSNQEAVADLKTYIKNGWTIFALARFCQGGCKHFFWITDIDEVGNVWAYDPYYGRKQLPPFNENSYYPFPRYRMAFGVKRL